MYFLIFSVSTASQFYDLLTFPDSLYTGSFYKRAVTVLSSLAVLFPTRIKVVEHEYKSRDEYRSWLIDGEFRNASPDTRAHSHTSRCEIISSLLLYSIIKIIYITIYSYYFISNNLPQRK